MHDPKVKISIITVSYNSEETIADTLESVKNQTYPNIEHIIVDGLSKDKTLSIVKSFPHVQKIICEKDNGIYDAMNKGIQCATGDYVGVLNSDDFYSSKNIIEFLVKEIQMSGVDSVFGDVCFVAQNNLNKRIRYYSSKHWNPEKFALGYMPAHPSFFVRKSLYNKYGLYKLNYKICADYELLIRFLYNNKITYKYIEKEIVTMREGGISNASIKSRILLNKEIVRACRENGISTNLFKLSFKIFRKLSEYIFIPKAI